MALEHGAINLSQGFPDFPVSPSLVELIHTKMKEGHNQYAPMPGTPLLRSAIANVVLSSFQRVVSPETDITITSGATEGIFATIAALVHPEDEVIIFDPSYDSYAPSVILNGGKPVHLNLHPPDFKIDWAKVKSKITPRTKMIMINTPHNPSGAVLTERDLMTLQEIAIQNEIIVLSDEVYERIIFQNEVHQSVLRYPALAEQSVAVFSFGKTFHATGWKTGYTVAPEYLTTEIRKAHQFVTFSVNTPVQLALAEYLTHPENYKHLGGFFQKKRDFFLDLIKGSSFRPLPCHGSYFQVVSYEGISGKSDIDMATWLTKEHKVASIPVSVFYKDKSDHHLLRFCFAKSDETLERAGEILRKF